MLENLQKVVEVLLITSYRDKYRILTTIFGIVVLRKLDVAV